MNLIASLLSNALLLAILAYLATELRRDMREVRDRVNVMWRWYLQSTGDQREHEEIGV